MPIIATPVPCASQPILTPDISKVFGCEQPAKRRTVSAVQGQTLSINWQFTDDAGNVVNLESCLGASAPFTGKVWIRIRETIALSVGTDPIITVEGSVVDVTKGQVQFDLPEEATLKAGVYLAEVGVFNSDDKLIFSNQLYLIVNRGHFGGDQSQVTGLPSIAEIRLHLRDSDGASNPLLETVQFDLSEIAAAIEYPILYWNESQPPVDQTYTTTTFPHRYHWMQAIVSRLYVTAAHWYRRNQLKFQGQGGIGVDDLNKSAEYEAKGDRLWQEWKDFVLRKKVNANADACVQWS